MKEEFKSHIYAEIEQPLLMVPILTKDKDVLWYSKQYINTNLVNNIIDELNDSFSKAFNKVKLYIDTYNFTLFIYNETFELLKEQTEIYDEKFELNKELKEKCNEYRNMLDVTLTIIHRILLEMDHLLSIKHLR